jgi:hypothetical protein
MKQASLLCENHFDETDIVKGFSGGKYFHPYERWRLSSSAVPKHHLGITIVTVLYYMIVVTYYFQQVNRKLLPKYPAVLILNNCLLLTNNKSNVL